MTSALRLSEVARVLVHFNQLASFIVNVNHGIMRTAAKLGLADCFADRVWFAVPQATELPEQFAFVRRSV
jgi:hypothetical protein